MTPDVQISQRPPFSRDLGATKPLRAGDPGAKPQPASQPGRSDSRPATDEQNRSSVRVCAAARRRHVKRLRVTRRATIGRMAATLAGWLLLAVALLVAIASYFTAEPADRMTDLAVYAAGGRAAAEGLDVYAVRTALGAPFTYPPIAAILAVPLAYLPVGLLHAIWATATLAAAVAVARGVLAPVVVRIGLPATTGLLLLSSPMRSHLRFGQVGVFLLLLVAMALLSGKRRRPWLVGLATAIKLTPGIFLLHLPTLGRRAALAGAGSVAVFTAVGLILLPRSANTYLTGAAWDSTRFGPPAWAGNQSMRGMLLRSGLPDVAVLVAWLIAAFALVLFAVLAARRLHRGGDQLAAVAVLAAASVAASPVSWVHHLLWLALPLAVVARAGRWRLAAAWTALLTASVPSVGSAGLRAVPELAPVWHLAIDAQGLTAVVAVFLIPRLGRQAVAAPAEPAPQRAATARA